MSRNTLITFVSTHHALKAEKLVAGAGLDFDIIPTPRAITASCGLSLELREEQLSVAVRLFADNQVKSEALYRRMAKDQYQKLTLDS